MWIFNCQEAEQTNNSREDKSRIGILGGGISATDFWHDQN
jgi:hypothetical protein